MKVKAQQIIPMREVPSRFYDPERDGVTFSLLTTFKQCREKARLVLNGWTSKASGLSQVFGGLVHGVNQRMYEDVRDGRLKDVPTEKYIKYTCRKVEAIWRMENPEADAATLGHLEFCMILLEAIMPVYFKYWYKDFQLLWDRVEKEFKMEFEVQLHHSQRTVKTFIRGKLDGSFRRRAKGRAWLFETKTRAQMTERGEADTADVLPHDLQPNIYLIFLWWAHKRVPEGLLYNIIRRPGQRQKKNETMAKFAQRVARDIKFRPEHYFIRMRMTVDKKDLVQNELELKDMVSDFIMWWNGLAGHYKNSDECRNKYGTCGMLPICSRGDYTGFYKRDRVFRELTDEL